jgi:hypothetical protein
MGSDFLPQLENEMDINNTEIMIITLLIIY